MTDCIKTGDRVAYTDKYFKRSFGVIQGGMRSRDWVTGRVIDAAVVEGMPMARVMWRLADRAIWIRSSALECV